MEFKVGDKVRVLPNSFTRYELHNVDGEIVQVVSDDIVYVVFPKHSAPSYSADYQWRLNSASERLEIISQTPKAIGQRQEKPCQVCKRNNDLGVSICWNCGNQPF